jgi:hypothetical protein
MTTMSHVSPAQSLEDQSHGEINTGHESAIATS